jgi:carbonic anhydrase
MPRTVSSPSLFVRLALAAVVGFGLALGAAVTDAPAGKAPGDVTLAGLLKENKGFADAVRAGRFQLPDATRQAPAATVLACSDSRVTPETIFGQAQGLGTMFTVRVAGNVVDDVTRASIQYGVEQLHTPLVVVLGHQECGAVKAAQSPNPPAYAMPLVKLIRPALKVPYTTLDAAVTQNVKAQVAALQSDPVVEAGAVVVGAIYDMTTGAVSVIQ